MATIKLELSGAAPVTLTFDDADNADIMAAFTAATGGTVKTGDDLVKMFAQNIMSQIQGVTQNYRATQNPATMPPVTVT